MTPIEVKELVKMQLMTRKPIRAPWYRPAGASSAYVSIRPCSFVSCLDCYVTCEACKMYSCRPAGAAQVGAGACGWCECGTSLQARARA